MRTRKRLQFASALALGLALVAPLMTTTAASAASSSNVLFFSSVGFTDTTEEDLEALAVVQATGATVTVFDGGDGSDTAWTAALAGIDVLVLPEPEGGDLLSPGGTSAMSVAAAVVLKDWVTAGGTVVAFGAYGYAEAISYLTGLDYSTGWSTGGLLGGGSWERQPGVDSALPATLPEGNATAGVEGILGWDPSLLVGFTPLYLSTDGNNAGVATFEIGAGTLVYLAYDWFPDEEDIMDGTRDDWNAVLSSFFTAPAAVDPAEPTLAETGADLGLLPIGGGMLLLGLAAMLFVRKRSAQRV